MTYSEIFDLIDTNLESGTKIPAIKHREVEHALLDYIQANLSQSGDIKRVKCDLTYLTDNFEADGLGKNLRLGWAICNGNNGTDNLAGRSGIGYGLGFSVLGQTGGYSDTTLVEHSHSYTQYTLDQEVATTGSGVRSLNKNNTQSGSFTTTTVGVSGTGKNYHPNIINLYIMKL